jgi:hypothetical protein
MQLRVARLCLDCEELHVGDSCPICASERYAFLATWLPVEERRRWRRAPVLAPTRAQRRFMAVRQWLADVFGDGKLVRPPGPPRTRASDHVPQFDFEPKPAPPSPSAADPQPLKSDVR